MTSPVLGFILILGLTLRTSVTSATPVEHHDRHRHTVRFGPNDMAKTPRTTVQYSEDGDATVVSSAELPPLLTFNNGTPVTNEAEWKDRRVELGNLLQEYIIGTFPTEVPAILSTQIVNSTILPGGLGESMFINATYNTTNKATLTFEIMLPAQVNQIPPGTTYPLFLTQTNHRLWAITGVERGYAACVYPGADVDDQCDLFKTAYPNATWGRISRRAWLASRVIDYLVTQSYVNKDQIAITGHSRNGKQSLLVAAFDERVTAVVSSSSGAPIADPYRFTSRYTFGEDPSDYLADWFLPSLKSYSGRENELPVDAHAVSALIAPRRVLYATAWTDEASDIPFAIERSYHAAVQVFDRIYNAKANIKVLYRPGNHHGWVSINSYFDFYDTSFGRVKGLEVTNDFIMSFNWTEWNTTIANIDRTQPLPSAPLQDRIDWVIGRPRPHVYTPFAAWGIEWPFISTMLNRDKYNPYGSDITRAPVMFGRNVWGHMYFSNNITLTTPRPAVVWLHPYSHQTGFCHSPYPSTSQISIYHRLAAAGYAVLAFDQIGFGERLLLRKSFYRRHPSSSMLRAMIDDTIAAIDAIQCASTAAANASYCFAEDPVFGLPLIDFNHVYLLGYALGGNVALHTAAMDLRVAGVASFSGFTPMKSDVNSRPTGGLQRLYDWHALAPKLGLVAGTDVNNVPYDYTDLLSLIAPRPTLLYTPQRDREATYSDVQQTVKDASVFWSNANATDKFVNMAPDTINEFVVEQHEAVLAWLDQQVASNTASQES